MTYRDSLEIVRKFIGCETYMKNNSCDGDCLFAESGCEYDVNRHDVAEACQIIIDEWERKERRVIVNSLIIFFVGVILGIFVGSTM